MTSDSAVTAKVPASFPPRHPITPFRRHFRLEGKGNAGRKRRPTRPEEAGSVGGDVCWSLVEAEVSVAGFRDCGARGSLGGPMQRRGIRAVGTREAGGSSVVAADLGGRATVPVLESARNCPTFLGFWEMMCNRNLGGQARE